MPERAVSLGLLADQARRATKRHRGDFNMIQNDQELKVARDRISYLLDLLARLRVSSRPEELALVSGGYRAEAERMQEALGIEIQSTTSPDDLFSIFGRP